MNKIRKVNYTELCIPIEEDDLFNDDQVMIKIGSGGMGTVYKTKIIKDSKINKSKLIESFIVDFIYEKSLKNK